MIDKEVIDRLVELGHVAEIEDKGDKAFSLVPGDLKAIDLSQFYPPKFIKETAKLIDGDSFSDYVNRFKTENTLVFASVTDTGARLVALLDYHGPPDKAARCEHLAVYETVPTTEWSTWQSANRQKMDQVKFAKWLEDNAKLFVAPSGADLLELVLTLEGKNEVNFTSAHRLESGKNKLDYTEDVTLRGVQSTKQGSVDLPRELVAGISPFHGAPKYSVRARLKCRIEGRKLSLWFETVEPHVIIRDSVLAVVKQVAEKTGITPLLGSV